jgi:hypothetical protein
MAKIDQIDGLREWARMQIRSGFLVPILRRHDLYVSVDEGDGRRFAALFRQTWKRLPLGIRRLLLAHWRSHHLWSPEVGLTRSPFIPRRAHGCVNRLGHRLLFRARSIARMPDDVAQDLIAHELAHVCQSARGIRCAREYRDGRADYVDGRGEFWGGNLEIEQDVDWEIWCWGFDLDSIDEWWKTAGWGKKVEYKDEQEARKALGRASSRLMRLGR